MPRKAGYITMSMQSLVVGILIVLLLVGSAITVYHLLGKHKEERVFRETMGRYHNTSAPEEQVRELNLYLDRYPRGPHAFQVKGLIEDADRQRGLDVMLDCSVLFNSRKSVPLNGRVQLLKTTQSYEAIQNTLTKNAGIGALIKKAAKDESARLEVFDAIGVHLRKAQAQVVAEAVVEKGKARFSHVAEGDYLVYGVASTDSNIIGIFDCLRVHDGQEEELQVACYSAYARNAPRRAERWQSPPPQPE